MPERDDQAGHSARLLRGLVWAGVLLAPTAAAVVLIGGNSSTVRFAVLLLAVSVVLIGASVLIRSDPVLLRMDVEDRVAQEVDAMRRELRAEFAGAVAGPAPQSEPRPPLPMRKAGAQVYGGGFGPPQPDFAAQQDFVAEPQFAEPQFAEPQFAEPQFAERTTFVHQPEAVAYDGQPASGYEEPAYVHDESGYVHDESGYVHDESGYVHDESGYVHDESGYGHDESGYGYDDGYQDEHPYEPQAPARATGGRAVVPGVVQPVSPAQVSQGFAARAGVPAPAGAVVPPVPVARASAAASVPVAPPGVPSGQPVPRPRAAVPPPPPGPRGMAPPGPRGMPPPGPNGMMAPPGPRRMAPAGLNGVPGPNGMAPPGPQGMTAPPARAAASVRPGTQYGRPEAPDDDFGAMNGYAGADDHHDADTSAEYKARRHRPSANDTNVGTLADFANYPGYDSNAQNW